MGSHATTDNLKHGGEFTVAFATKQTMVASDFVGIVSAKNDPKKMEKTSWTIKKATKVNAPVFTDFPMTLECRIKEKYDESETGYYLRCKYCLSTCYKKNTCYLSDEVRTSSGKKLPN